MAGEDLVPETVSRSSRSTPASRFVQADPFSHRPETEDQQVFIQYVVECSRLDVMRFLLKMLIVEATEPFSLETTCRVITYLLTNCLLI